MATTVFDTLQYAKKLEKAGFTPEQAEIQAETLKEIIQDNIATKSYLEYLKKDLTIRMGVLAVTIISVLAVIIKL